MTDGESSPTLVGTVPIDTECVGQVANNSTVFNPDGSITSTTTYSATPASSTVVGILDNGSLVVAQGRLLYSVSADGQATLLLENDDIACSNFFGGASARSTYYKVIGSSVYWVGGGSLTANKVDVSGVRTVLNPAGTEAFGFGYVVEGNYWFSTRDPDTANETRSIWKSEGTPEATSEVATYVGSLSSLQALNGTLFGLIREDSITTLRELDEANASFVPTGVEARGFVGESNGQLIYDTVFPGLGLFSFDGTTATILSESAVNTVISNGLIYFVELDRVASDVGPLFSVSRLGISDGTVEGTTVTDIDLSLGGFFSPSNTKLYAAANGGVFYLHDDNVRGIQAWYLAESSVLPKLLTETEGSLQVVASLNDDLLLNYSSDTGEKTFGNLSVQPDLFLTDYIVPENAANGTVVGIPVDFASLDSVVSASYAITSGDPDNAFQIESATGKIFVANSDAIDFETTNRYQIQIEATLDFDFGDEETATIPLPRYYVFIDIEDVEEIVAPEEAIGVVIDDIQDALDTGDLNNGQANPTQNFLAQALKSINKGKPGKAAKKINDAIARIENLIDGGDLDPQLGEEWIDLLETALSLL